MENAETLRVWLEALIGTNRVFLEHHPKTKPLYSAGVKYARTDDWEPIPCLYAKGYHGTDRYDSSVVKRYGVFGDCKSLACARVAELHAQGKYAEPSFRFDIKPITAPHGSLISSDGRIIAPDGRVVAPYGTIGRNGVVLGRDGEPKTRLMYHILVRISEIPEKYEDPSKVCGMTDNEWSYM